MAERTTDVGYSKQMQYGDRRARRHAVKKDASDRWVTACTEKAATREYKGWVDTVNCKACRVELGADVEEDE